MLPRTLKGFNLFVDGRGYIGRVLEAKLPDLNLETEAYRGAGMDAPVDLDMGMSALDFNMTIGEFDPELVKLFGLFNASTPIVVRGAIQRQGEDAVPVVIRLQGGLKQITRDPLKQGQNSTMQVTANCNRYREEINGETLVEIDILNSIRIINGVDQLASMRQALAI